jgi:hypothetical protein
MHYALPNSLNVSPSLPVRYLDSCLRACRKSGLKDPPARTTYNMHVKPRPLLEGLVCPYSDRGIKNPIETFSRKFPLLITIHYVNFSVIYLSSLLSKLGDRGSTVVGVLCYKSEGRCFDSRWWHWNFSLT